MAYPLSADLYIRACLLRRMLQEGNGEEIQLARDRLRTKMIEGYRSGYWKEHPEKLREYMQLQYRVDRLLSSLGPHLALTKRPKTPLDRQLS